MRILILSFAYAPRPNPRAIRWSALAESLQQRGHTVSVVTSWQPGLPATEAVNGVSVHRVGARPLERVRELLAGRRSSAPAPAAGDRTGGIAGMVHFLNRSIWRHLWWPDSTCIWLFPALRRARNLIGEHGADAVISVSPTFTAVLAGYLLAGRAGSRRPWIIDLGDPFSFMCDAAPNNFRLYSAVNRWLERNAFKRASAISVTNSAVATRYAELYPEAAPKIVVIPPLVSPARAADRSTAPFFTARGGIRLTYIGTLYRTLRRPDYLLRLFDELLNSGAAGDFELHFIGDVHECEEVISAYARRARGKITVHGPVSHERAAQAALEADMLINIGNKTAFQLPSKIVEYAATGKPILSIDQEGADICRQFFADYPNSLCLTDGGAGPTREQASAFLQFCRDKGGRIADAAGLERLMARYGLESVMALYESLLGEEGATAREAAQLSNG